MMKDIDECAFQENIKNLWNETFATRIFPRGRRKGAAGFGGAGTTTTTAPRTGENITSIISIISTNISIELMYKKKNKIILYRDLFLNLT